MRRLLARLLLAAIVLIGLTMTAAVAGKAALEMWAQRAAERFVGDASALERVDDRVRAIAASVHEAYIRTDPSKPPALLFRLRPYLTHPLLPEFIRVETGAIEAIMVEGECDSAARTTVYLLQAVGIEAEQFNIITASSGGHSIVRAYRDDGSEMIIDPQSGSAPVHGDRILDWDSARTMLSEGTPTEDVWLPIAESGSHHQVIEEHEHVFVAAQGEALAWTVTVDLSAQDEIRIGREDGSYTDVISEGTAARLTSYWHYFGHRYDRGWERRLSFNRATRVTIYLTDPIHEPFITSNVPPRQVSKQILEYDVPANGILSFRDGDAGRDWTSLRSYQDVDAIVFTRMD